MRLAITPVLSCHFFKSLLTAVKLSNSRSLWSKARITLIPSSCWRVLVTIDSLITRILAYKGLTMRLASTIIRVNTKTMTRNHRVKRGLIRNAIIMAPVTIIGALKKSLKNWLIPVWIWKVSPVKRVTKLDVPISSRFSFDKRMIFAYKSLVKPRA